MNNQRAVGMLRGNRAGLPSHIEHRAARIVMHHDHRGITRQTPGRFRGNVRRPIGEFECAIEWTWLGVIGMVRPRVSTRQDGTSDAIALLSIIARGAAHLRASRAIATLDVVYLRAVLTGNPDAARNRVKRKTMNVDDCVRRQRQAVALIAEDSVIGNPRVLSHMSAATRTAPMCPGEIGIVSGSVDRRSNLNQRIARAPATSWVLPQKTLLDQALDIAERRIVRALLERCPLGRRQLPGEAVQ